MAYLMFRAFLATALFTGLACVPALANHKQYAPVSTGSISCPTDQIVWVNTRTRIYHLEGERWFGRTKQGKYVCEKAAKAEGDRETENGQ